MINNHNLKWLLDDATKLTRWS